MDVNKSISLEDAFTLFIDEKIGKNLKEETIKDYEMNWGLFQRYLEQENIQFFNEITPQTIDNYVTYTKERNPNIKNTTINTYLRNIKVILNYFMKCDYMNKFEITLLRVEKRLKEPYTDEEIERLIKKPNLKKCDFTEFRTWAMVCYFISTGNRSKTVRNLKNKDIDFQNELIHLNVVKNGIPYDIPIPSILYPVLREYMKIRGGKPEDYLFCNQYGEGLTANGLKVIISKYNLSRGVEKTSPHLFRHYFAKNWILNDGSAKKLQFALGHSTSHMVDNYVNIYGRDLKEDFDTYNPLNQFRSKIQKEKIQVKKKKL